MNHWTLIKPGIFLVLAWLTPVKIWSQPLLNSRPGCDNVIYLDFDGETTSGTWWNSGTVTYAPTGISNEGITNTWKAISELYIAFNVNVTTDRNVYDNTPVGKRQMVIHTPSCGSGFGANCSSCGVSFVPSFGTGQPNFSICYGAYLWAYGTTAHELGHAMGCGHQHAYASGNCSTMTAEYNGGVSNGDIGWSPVMGGYTPMMRFYDGYDPVTHCQQNQNDVEIIKNKLGAIPDDFGNTIAAAGTITFDNTIPCSICNTNFTANGIQGIINYLGAGQTDTDFFRLVVPAATTRTLNVLPFEYGSTNIYNINLELTIYNSSGTVLFTANDPNNARISSFNYTFAPGTYYFGITVKPYNVSGNAANPTGTIGQLGRYWFNY